MTSKSTDGRECRSRASCPHEQRGVVLFIALIVMVALSLAGIALLRSTDTAGIVAGNLAFKQAAAAAADRSLETAIHAMWDGATPIVANKNADNPAQNYYACVRNAAGTGCIAAGASIPDRPDAVTSVTKLTAAGLSAGLVPTDTGGNNVYYVIERMCFLPGNASFSNCNLTPGVPGFGANAGTQHYTGFVITGTPNPYYRLTVRVEGPRNTVTYAQAILQ